MSDLKRLVELVEEGFKLSDEQAEEIITVIRRRVTDYVYQNKLKSLVVGVSGGLDSAVVSALCQEKYTGVPLIGLHIPMNSLDEHKEQAGWVGAEYCSAYDNVHYLDRDAPKIIDDVIFGNETITFPDSLLGVIQHNTIPVRQGNIKARLRMITLYDMARACNGLVLSTDNYSEYLAGFWTLMGDVGDMGPIQYVWKGLELSKIAEILNIREDIITQAPSDGLGVTEENTDEAQLGCDYKTFDSIMVAYLREGTLNDFTGWSNLMSEASEIINRLKVSDCEEGEIFWKVINRYEGTHFKRNGCPKIDRWILNGN